MQVEVERDGQLLLDRGAISQRPNISCSLRQVAIGELEIYHLWIRLHLGIVKKKFCKQTVFDLQIILNNKGVRAWRPRYLDRRYIG